jgi:tellurite resistance protein TehA-like permease
VDGFLFGVSDRASRANAAMNPVYFALVMATGIVSTALFFLGHREASQFLFWVNLAAYPVLIVATAYRAARYTDKIWADLTNPQAVFAFFTFVAASSVLGVQCFVRGYEAPALALWLTALVSWLLLTYFSVGMLTLTNSRPLGEVVNASWLVAIVGTQSLTVLGALLARQFGGGSEALILFVFSLWSIGVALYGIFITLIIHRLFFQTLDPRDMLPPYWIILGATAISALAGANLLAAAPAAPFLGRLTPLIEGVTLALWAWSSWWIPTLVVFGIWRHAVCRVPVTYHPGYWSLVFPLGMYTVATYRVALVMHLPFLAGIPAVTVWVALAAWAATMAGLLQSAGRAFAEAWTARGSVRLPAEAPR